MKLLLDHNLSPRLVQKLSHSYNDIAHVRDHDLHCADDATVWQFAIDHDFIIVSKDSDFHQLAFLIGPPPKVVWVRLGNCATRDVERLLIEAREQIEAFSKEADSAFLILE